MPDAYRLEILTLAWQDIDRFSDLHLPLVGPQSAEKITDKLLDTITLLASQPFMGALHPDTVEQWADVRDKRADAVDDDPRAPNALEPIPCLIGLRLCTAHFSANDRNRTHQAGKDGRNGREFGINVFDNTVCGRPHILYGECLRDNDRPKDQQYQCDPVKKEGACHPVLIGARRFQFAFVQE